MGAMVRDVIVRNAVTQKTHLFQEIDVFAPVALGELVPRPANLLAHLHEALRGRQLVACGGFLHHVGGLTISLRRDDPCVGALGKKRLRRRERQDVDLATAQAAMGEGELERLAGKTKVMLDARDALFLERKENSVRRAHADRGVMTEVNSKCESVVHGHGQYRGCG
jgi:hypothetical protein